MIPIRSFSGRLILWVLVVVLFLYSVLPVLWTLLQSLKTNLQASARTPIVFFRPTLANYQKIWLDAPPSSNWPLIVILTVCVITVIGRFWSGKFPWPSKVTGITIALAIGATLFIIPRMLETSKLYSVLLTSVEVTAATMVLALLIAAPAGYALARYAGAAAVVVLLAALTFRALPVLGYVLPYFWFAQRTGLFDTKLLLSAALVALNLPFSVWLLRGFFRDCPPEIEDAAMIDGANKFQTFRLVVVPIVWPGIIATALFVMLLAYQEFMLVQVITQENTTLPVASSQYLGGRGVATDIAVQSAAVISGTIPLLVVVMLFQKHLVKGLGAGAIKG